MEKIFEKLRKAKFELEHFYTYAKNTVLGKAYLYLGNPYFNESAPLKDYEMGIEYYKQAVCYGNADAAYYLATYYAENADAEKADFYIDLAIKYGSMEAKMVKGVVEFHARNVSIAACLLEEAAKAGDSDAQYYFGMCYLEELYSAYDYNQGVYWLIKSADGGNRNACDQLSRIYYTKEMSYADDSAKTI